ncbi:hypothetical protein GCM10010912_59630 [Paenibacillus albidus]|uniref:AMP-dependent synthetase/ligase domain-containing protein n=1 Tax=Paenibacillus albidus TaxID=2041023 RepID=A0A917D1W9_9BACL|nr:amino acid adenylation domain-containing protein [Paenibacillus albidus]GGG07044.1 hypothetical protein GCM10010912_59630 [Paenibacillus albidus]
MEEDRSLIETIVDRMSKNADSTALRFNTEKLTYRELDEKSLYYAAILQTEGIKENDIVGISVKRGLDMILLILAVLRAGACFLPIDLSLPKSRKQYIITNSNMRCLLVDEECWGKFHDLQVINIATRKASQGMPQYTAPRIKSNQLAYVIYTSGSTGLPKGVMIEHGSLKQFALDIQKKIDFSQIQSILCLTNMSFDIFIVESLLPLSLGKEVVMAEEKYQRNPLILANLIRNEKIDMVQMTPTSMSMLLQFKRNNHCLLHLKLILIGGEPFPLHLLHTLRSITDSATIYNMYGPTEATIWVTAANVTDALVIHLGDVFESSQIMIIDADGNSINQGGIGELYILGQCLARGYLNNPEKTRERFSEYKDDLHTKKVYRTGDLVKLSEKGQLLFVGRVDNQVKIRGHRIELEEVEQIMISYDGVKQAIVFVDKNERGHENYLSALYCSDHTISASYWYEYLAEWLPDYMIPVFFRKVDHIPTNSNGKMDRNFIIRAYTDRGESYGNQ